MRNKKNWYFFLFVRRIQQPQSHMDTWTIGLRIEMISPVHSVRCNTASRITPGLVSLRVNDNDHMMDRVRHAVLSLQINPSRKLHQFTLKKIGKKFEKIEKKNFKKISKNFKKISKNLKKFWKNLKKFEKILKKFWKNFEKFRKIPCRKMKN